MQKVKTDLKNQKLEDSMTAVAKCSITRLLNGVTHIWSEEFAVSEPAPNPTLCATEEDEGDAAVPGIVRQEVAMDSIVVKEESVDMGDNEEENQTYPLL